MNENAPSACGARVVLELSLEQAASVRDMLDLAVRIQMGQFEEIVHCFAHGRMKIRAFGGDAENAGVEEIGKMRSLIADLKSVARHPPSGSFGISHHGVGLDGKRAHEVGRVLAQAIAAENKAPSISVDHDGLLVRYTNDLAPTATVRRSSVPEAG